MTDTARPRPSVAYRWMVLVFISLAQGGNYYIYDSINPLEDIFKQQLGYNGTMFGWLNSSYSVAALLTLLIGGIVIDRIGTKKALTFFGGICLAGALLTAIHGSFITMVIGRTVLGLGAESMIVAVTTALAKWFKGKELSFAFGVNLTIARIASVLADQSPNWAHGAFYPNGDGSPASWQKPLFLAVGAGIICVVTAVMYWILESRAEGRYELGQAGSVDKLEFSQMFSFNRSYWYVVALCFTFYSAIFPFRTFAIEFFQNKILADYGGLQATAAAKVTALQQAGALNSLLPFTAMIATPLFGLLVDRLGKRALFMMAGSFMLMPVYLMMAYLSTTRVVSFSFPWVSDWHFVLVHAALPLNLLITMTMMGLVFSLIPAIMWPSIAYLVDQSRLGTAYALMTLIQQIGFFALNLSIGRANDYSHAGLGNAGGYALGMWIFSILGFVGLLFSVLLRIRETGPESHGLETITAASSAG